MPGNGMRATGSPERGVRHFRLGSWLKTYPPLVCQINFFRILGRVADLRTVCSGIIFIDRNSGRGGPS